MDSTVEQVSRRTLSPTRYARLALASAASLYLIVLTGAAVRLTGSGLACESWPGCQEGAFFPAIGEHSSIEFGNRVMALFPIALSLAAWFFAFRTQGLGRWVRWLAAFTFLGTIAQAPLGLLTIRLDLHPLMVGTHFLLALVVLATAIVVAVEAWGNATGRIESPAPYWLRLVGLVLVGACAILVVTGTLSTASGPHPGDSAEIQRFWNLLDAVYIHVRATAAFGICFLLLLVWLYRNREQAGVLMPGAALLLGVLLTQMLVGELQWHVALAALVWACTVALVTALWRTPRRLT